jgi:lipopolysaccharide transport system permease protein
MRITSSIANFAIPRRLVYGRDLMRELVVRDLKLRYKRSYLGVGWTLVNPLLQLLVFNFVFTKIFRAETPNFVGYLFIGITSWNWFSGGLLESTNSILVNRDLIRQPGFPAIMLPNVTVASHLIHFLLTLPVLAILTTVGIPIGTNLFWLPVVVLVQYLLTFSLALFAASLHVTFRDTQYLLGVFLMLGFFLTPILYDLSVVPERYLRFYRLNPMSHLIDAYRAVLLRGETPDLRSLASVAALSVLQFGVFYLFFQRASTRFAEEI